MKRILVIAGCFLGLNAAAQTNPNNSNKGFNKSIVVSSQQENIKKMSGSVPSNNQNLKAVPAPRGNNAGGNSKKTNVQTTQAPKKTMKRPALQEQRPESITEQELKESQKKLLENIKTKNT